MFLFRILISIFSICLTQYVFAADFTVDADLNSISPIYYQNVRPPYETSPLNTGISLTAGDFIKITANGIWSNAPVSYNLIFGPDGNPNENIADSYPGAGYPVAALMGKIGNNGYFFIGRTYSQYVDNSGILYLGFNDTDYGNNWGSLDVTVVPEPLSLGLFILGGVILGFLKVPVNYYINH